MFPKCIEAFSGTPFDSTRIMSFERIYSLSQSPNLAPIEELFDQQDHLNPETPQDLWFQYWDSYDERLKKRGIRLWTLEEADQTRRVFFRTHQELSTTLNVLKLHLEWRIYPHRHFKRRSCRCWNPVPCCRNCAFTENEKLGSVGIPKERKSFLF